MKILKTVPHFTNEEIREIRDSFTEIRAFIDWQIILSVQENQGKEIKESSEFASMLGVTKSRVHYVIQSYNKYGKDWRIYGQWGGRREERCHLKIEDEKLLMQSLEKDALQGKILTFSPVKKKVEDFIGKKVSDDYIWDLFNRHGWSKKMPRPQHPTCTLRSEVRLIKRHRKSTCTAYEV
jgi:transposase